MADRGNIASQNAPPAIRIPAADFSIIVQPGSKELFMTPPFQPGGRATLIGSQPLSDHGEAFGLIQQYTPDIPTWAQLPIHKQEGMVSQFMEGMPGLVQQGERFYVDTTDRNFDEQLLAFFETYLSLGASQPNWDTSCFALTPGTAQGFFTLLQSVKAMPEAPLAIKGQITGPITFGMALKQQDGRAVFYNEVLRDAAVKLLAMKAAWQVRALSTLGRPVILFIDEPSLAGYGSSELISVSKEQIGACLQEVIDAIHTHGGLAGVHVCANTDWSLLFDSAVDVVNFDAHGYFDKLILYGEVLKRFLDSGRLLAWGLIPTVGSETIEQATVETLWADWRAKSEQVAALGIASDCVRRQALITPSCGTGSLTPELSRRVLMLTRQLSERIQAA
jgi:hypothetical protein